MTWLSNGGLRRSGSVAACALALLCTVSSVSAEVLLSGAWLRALPPTQNTTAAYVSVHNQGSTSVAVIGGRAELTAKVEVHQSLEEEGFMRMRPVPSLVIAPQESVELAPGGLHLMLLELERMPTEGELLELCLSLDDGSESCTEARVQRGPEQHMDHSQHH